jgi:hypothetical protein
LQLWLHFEEEFAFARSTLNATKQPPQDSGGALAAEFAGDGSSTKKGGGDHR